MSTLSPLSLERLNEQQRQAVVHTDGPLLLLSGAGSGKTRVITYRIAHLIRKQAVPARRILAVTFTNKAAEEMKKRLRGLVKAEDHKQLTVCTFHALGVRIMRKHAHLLRYRERFSICNQAEQLALIKRLMEEMRVDPNFIKPETLLYRIGDLKNDGILPGDLDRAPEDELTPVINDFFPRYQRALQTFNMLDFSDLLCLPLKLFAGYDEVRREYARRFRYLMIDEYQDTNPCQYRLARALTDGPSPNICVVGDDDQSIYSWRGADISNILNFERDFQDVTVIRLEKNYRSSGTIIDVANRLIRQNTSRKEKTMRAHHGAGDRVRVVECENETAEAEWLAGDLSAHLAANRNLFGDYAVLFRANHLTRPVEEQLMMRRVPYVLIGGKKFYDRKEVKDAVAYIKYLANEHDEVSLLRMINYPKRGIAEGTVRKLMDFAMDHEISLHDALLRHGEVEALTHGPSHRAIDDFLQLVKRYRHGLFNRRTIVSTIRDLYAEIGLKEAIVAEENDPKIGLRKYEAVQSVVSGIKQYVDSDPKANIFGYLERLSLFYENEDANRPQEKAVTLITLHSAKGMEFPHVYICGFEKDIMPHLRSLEEGSVEEERRLLYVGITRAMKSLVMTYAVSRKRMGEEKETGVSPFIEELPGELLLRESPFERAYDDEDRRAMFAEAQALLEGDAGGG